MAKEKASGKRIGVWSVAIWILLAIVLSAFAPGGKEFVTANKDAGLPADAKSIIAERNLEKYFPQDGGLPLFAVFHQENGLSDEDILGFAEALESLQVESTIGEVEVIPLTKLQPEQRKAFLSENGKTYFVPLTLPGELESKDLNDLVKSIKVDVGKNVDESVEVSWTGPAGIASDAVELFSRADVVLLLSTVGLILVLLLLIYRSPLLAFIPLIGAAIVYVVVDKVIGLTTQAEWFSVDSQALSIMTILLFAVLTDYSLLIFSRYREELRRYESPSEAMRETMRHVNEPIFFSGSTIVLGVATLFFALYEPYRNFAPAFAIAAIAMLIAGLTLLPALFALIGRKAFWPVIPKFGDVQEDRQSIWGKVANKVTKRPVMYLVPILLLLLIGAWNVTNMKESYDLIESFPEDLSSRVGYERLSESFSEGSLAPSTLLFVSDQELGMGETRLAIEKLEDLPGINSISAQGNPASEDGKSAKFSITFEGNPYDKEALDAVKELRVKSESIIERGRTNRNRIVRCGGKCEKR